MKRILNYVYKHLNNIVSGSAVAAMAGKNCVAIATDTRYGTDSLTIATDVHKVFQLNSNMFVGFAGLYADALTLLEDIKSRMDLYELTTKNQMKCRTVVSQLSSMLFEKRFGNYLVDSVVASLENNEPIILSLDCYGYPIFQSNFAAAGTCKGQLLGMCENFWRENMDEQELFETIAQTMLNSINRDAYSGCGIIVYTINNYQVTKRTVRVRID